MSNGLNRWFITNPISFMRWNVIDQQKYDGFFGQQLINVPVRVNFSFSLENNGQRLKAGMINHHGNVDEMNIIELSKRFSTTYSRNQTRLSVYYCPYAPGNVATITADPAQSRFVLTHVLNGCRLIASPGPGNQCIVSHVASDASQQLLTQTIQQQHNNNLLVNYDSQVNPSYSDSIVVGVFTANHEWRFYLQSYVSRAVNFARIGVDRRLSSYKYACITPVQQL